MLAVEALFGPALPACALEYILENASQRHMSWTPHDMTLEWCRLEGWETPADQLP